MAVERALRTAAPHDLLDALRDCLTRCYAASEVELLMIDYSLSVLQPVSARRQPGAAVPAHGNPAGRAFGAQELFAQEDGHDGAVIAYVPVTVRGDRLGVLTARLPAGGLTPEVADELCEIAEMLAREILVAGRDTDLYLQARRRNRLTLAAEMQWQLLPAQACRHAEYAIGAQLEPAYAIHGDNFDWSAGGDRLVLTVSNGMGEGIEAALLTNLAVNALRNARRAGISIADQAALADQAVYAQYRGRMFLSVLLLDFALDTGRVRVVDAGSPQLLRLRTSTVERVPFEAQLPLGMADETPYGEQEFEVRPGDRLIIVSDGVSEVASTAGERYGERALIRAIHATRLLPAAEVPRAILAELAGHRAADPDDDALIVCVDWYGRPGADA
nr:PP2C family protein-serine/threonine phosphatase [Kitasatospora sp. SolWspMP-SS2h]